MVEVYSNKFPLPKIMMIDILTEEKGLDAVIWIDTKSYAPSFGDDEEGKRASKAYYEKYFPKIVGYRTVYFRDFDSENLHYTTVKDSEEFTKIDLKAEKLLKN